MRLEYDQDKRNKTLKERGLDFAEAVKVFSAPVMTMKDNRADYGENRFLSFGILEERMVVLVWTQRGEARRIISMRYANEREKNKYRKFLG